MSFAADQFTATPFATAADKARFANQFVKFATRGFPRTAFPKWFYARLSNTFGHIAHYNIDGFYDYFFKSGPAGIDEFLHHTLNGGGYGSPAHTHCDVEEALQNWLRTDPQGQAVLRTHARV